MMQNKNKQPLAIIARLDHQKKFTPRVPNGKPSPDMPNFGIANYFVDKNDLSQSEIAEFEKSGFEPLLVENKSGQKKYFYVFTCVSGRGDTKVFIPHYKAGMQDKDKKVLKRFEILGLENVENIKRVAENPQLQKHAGIDDLRFEDLKYIGIDVSHVSLARLGVKDLNNLSKNELAKVKKWQGENSGILLLKDSRGNLGFFTHDRLVDLENGSQPTKISRTKLESFGQSSKKLSTMQFSSEVNNYNGSDRKDIIHMVIASVDNDEMNLYITIDAKKSKRLLGKSKNKQLGNRELNLTKVQDGIKCQFYDPVANEDCSYLITSNETLLSVQQYNKLVTLIKHQRPIPQSIMNIILREMALQGSNFVKRAEDMQGLGKSAWMSQEFCPNPGLDDYLKDHPDEYDDMVNTFLDQMVKLNNQNLTAIDMKPDMFRKNNHGDWMLVDMGGIVPVRQNDGLTTVPRSKLGDVTEFYCPITLGSANNSKHSDVDLIKLQVYLIAANMLDMAIIASRGGQGCPYDKTIYSADEFPAKENMQSNKIYFLLKPETGRMYYYYLDSKNQRQGAPIDLNAEELVQAEQGGIPSRIFEAAQEHHRAHDRAHRKALIEQGNDSGFDDLKLNNNQRNLIKTAMQDFNKPDKPGMSAEDMKIWANHGKRALVAHWVEKYAENYLKGYRHDGEEQALLREKIEATFPEIRQQKTIKQRYIGKNAEQHQAGDRILRFFAISNEQAAARLKTECIGVLSNTMIKGEEETITAGKLLFRMGNGKKDLLYFFNKDDDLKEKDFKQFHIKTFVSDKISRLIQNIFKGKSPVADEEDVGNESLTDAAIASFADDNGGHKVRKRSGAIGDEDDAESQNISPHSPNVK